MSLQRKTRSENLPRKRYILDYVDPYGGLPYPKATAMQHRARRVGASKLAHNSPKGPLPCNRKGVVDMPHTKDFNMAPEHWEGLSPTKFDFVPLSVNFPGAVASTPKNKHRSRSKSPHLVKQCLLSPLPPSSPPSSLSQDIAPHEGGREDIDFDPFGFLAMEKILKARKCTLARANFEMKMVTCSLSVEGTGKRLLFPSGKKQVPDNSPTALSNLEKSHSLSPCQQATRRKSKARKDEGLQRARKDRLASPGNDDREFKMDQLETAIWNGSKKSVKKRAHTRHRTRIRGRRMPKESEQTIGVAFSALNHLDDESREKFEMQREERLRYYQRLDSYQLCKEKVWIV